MKAILFALCLIAVVVSGARLRRSREEFPQLKKIEQNSWGKELLDTIALQIQTATPFEDILGLLAQIEGSLNEEQSSADSAHRSAQSDYEDRKSTLQNTIDNAQAEISDASIQINQLNNEIDALEATRLDLEAQIGSVEDNIADYRSRRNDDSNEYDNRRRQQLTVLQALQDAYDEVNLLVGRDEPALLQVVTKNLKKIGRTNPILAFAQIASTADQDTVNKLLALLQTLINSVNAGVQSDNAAEELSKETYEEQTTQLSTLLADLNSQHDDVVANLASRRTRLAAQQERLEENTETLNNANDQYALNESSWAQTVAVYESESAGRAEELDIVHTVQNLIAEKFGGVSDYLSGRIADFGSRGQAAQETSEEYIPTEEPVAEQEDFNQATDAGNNFNTETDSAQNFEAGTEEVQEEEPVYENAGEETDANAYVATEEPVAEQEDYNRATDAGNNFNTETDQEENFEAGTEEESVNEGIAVGEPYGDEESNERRATGYIPEEYVNSPTEEPVAEQEDFNRATDAGNNFNTETDQEGNFAAGTEESVENYED